MSDAALAAFARAVRRTDAVAPPLLRAADDTERARRLAVHRNTHVVTLVDALAQAFPVTRELLGDACFDALALARVRRDPPRTPVLAEWAVGLPAFAEDYRPLDAAPFARGLLQLEALRIEAYHAADAAPWPAAALAAWLDDPARLAGATVRLHPAARWRRLPHAVVSLWAAHQDPSTRDDALAALDIDAAEDALVTRPLLDVETHALPVGGIALLDALAAGQPIGAALVRAEASGGDAVAAFNACLHAGAIHALVHESGTCP